MISVTTSVALFTFTRFYCCTSSYFSVVFFLLQKEKENWPDDVSSCFQDGRLACLMFLLLLPSFPLFFFFFLFISFFGFSSMLTTFHTRTKRHSNGTIFGMRQNREQIWGWLLMKMSEKRETKIE